MIDEKRKTQTKQKPKGVRHLAPDQHSLFMKSRLQVKKISKTAYVSLLTIAALGGLVITAYAFSTRNIVDAVGGISLTAYLPGQPDEVLPDAVIAESGNQPAFQRNLRFSLYDVGVLPREMTIEAGKLNLSIENFSGLSGAVRIVRDDGSESPEIIVEKPADKTRSRTPVTLAAGKYRLVMVEKPENFSSIIVAGSGE